MPAPARQRWPLRVWALVVCALVCAPATGSAPAVAVEPRVVPGVLLPAYDAPPGVPVFVSASADYVALQYGQFDENAWTPILIRDAATGAVVRSVVDDPALSSAFDPVLRGPVLVTGAEKVAGSGQVGRVRFENLATGATAGPVDLPAGDRMLGAGPDYVLTSHPEDTGTTSPPETIHLLGPDGSVRTVDGLPQLSDPQVKALAGPQLLLTNGSALWLVDVGAATAELLASGDTWGPYNFAALTPTRVIWQSGGQSFVQMPPSTPFSWRTRSGGAVTTIPVSTYGDVVAAGNGLGVLDPVPDSFGQRRRLSPVSMTDGSVGAVIAEPITAFRSTAEGSLWLALADTPAGTLKVAEPAGLRTVASMPPLRMQAWTVQLDGDRAVVVWSDPSVYAARPVLTTSLGGAGTWSAPGDPALVEPTGGGYSEWGQSAGGVSVFEQPNQSSSSYGRHYRVLWTGGERDVVSWYSTPGLGRGGQVLIRRPGQNDPTARLEDPRTGTLLTTVANPQASAWAVEKTTLWQASAPDGTFTRRDLAGSAAATTVATDLHCHPYSLQVVRRWALVVCDGGFTGPGTWLVDLQGLVPAWSLTQDSNNFGVVIGNGFVAWVHNAAAQYQPVELSLVVADLTGSHARRSYGPLRGQSRPPGTSYTPDDAGAARLLYVDPQYQPRLVTLDWLGTAPTPDVTPPALISASTPGRVATGTGLAFRYSFSDAVGVVSYDVEYRHAPLATGPGAWTHPASWFRKMATSVSMTAAAGSDTCFHVRARDAAGNVSGWSPPACQAVPLDDKALGATGTARRVATGAVPSRQVSTLASAGAALTHKGIRSNHIAVTAQLGPAQGAVDVFVGKTKVGRASFVTAKNGWGTVWLPAGAIRGGALRLIRVGSVTATIDGVVLAQQ